MSGSIYFKDDRKVLPQLERTSTYKDTESPVNIKNELGVNSMQPIINLKEENLDNKLIEWRKSKNYSLAGDILSQAIVSKKLEDYTEVKEYLLSNYPKDTILKWLFGERTSEKKNEERIKHNFKKLSLEPKDALTWTDQAINYISINNRAEAIECIEEAVKINSNMGFIIRNASRIFNLIGDTNRSIKLLKNSEYYKYDPQIVSAEIAFSQLENRKTQGIDIADKLLVNNKYKNHEKSELASTLGTIEFFKKNYKKSEELFNLSLLAPNRNSFAQSLWYKKEEISPQKFKAYEHSNEIQTRRNSKENNFTKALEYSLKWIKDEPYSVRPYRVSSHISGVLLGDTENAYNLITQAMEAQKAIKGDNFTKKEELEFNNDIAYYLLKSNRVQEAEKYIEPLLELQNKSTKLDDIEYINIATLGLFAYKNQDINLGNNLYRKTITHFLKTKQPYLAGSAFLNFFDEEIRIKKELDELAKLRTELDDLIPNDSDDNELLFRKKNSITLFNDILSKLK